MKRSTKKRWLWGIIALSIFILPQFVLAWSPFNFDIYFRLFINFTWAILALFFAAWIMVVPFKKLYKPHVEVDRKRVILGWICKGIGLIFFVGIFYVWLMPLTVGAYHLFALQEPLETITDQIVSLNSSGRYVTSYSKCIYLTCSFELRGNPDRNLDYFYPTPVSVSGTYEFFILPKTDIVLGVQNPPDDNSVTSQNTFNFVNIASLQDYDSRLVSICNQYASTSDQSSFATCVYTVMLNDEMATGTLKTFAEQEQLAVDESDALNLSTDQLVTDLSQGLTQLESQYSTELAITILADEREYLNRSLEYPVVDAMVKLTNGQYGACLSTSVC